MSPENILRGTEQWTLIDPSTDDEIRPPFTEPGMHGPTRDLMAVGRSVLPAYLGYEEGSVPELITDFEADPALKRFFGELVGDMGHSRVPTALQVVRRARKLLTVQEQMG